MNLEWLKQKEADIVKAIETGKSKLSEIEQIKTDTLTGIVEYQGRLKLIRELIAESTPEANISGTQQEEAQTATRNSNSRDYDYI